MRAEGKTHVSCTRTTLSELSMACTVVFPQTLVKKWMVNESCSCLPILTPFLPLAELPGETFSWEMVKDHLLVPHGFLLGFELWGVPGHG